MAAIYVALIIKGRTFSSIPSKLKPEVRQKLIDKGMSYLIDE